MKPPFVSRLLRFSILALLFLPGCSRERGDLSKRELPEYFGVFATGAGKRPEPLPASEKEAGPDLQESAVFVVHLQGLSSGGNPEERIQLFDRARVRHEVEQVKSRREGPVIRTRIQPPSDLFASFQKLPLRFRPAPKPDMLVAVPDEPLKPGLYVLRTGGQEYPFSVRIGGKPLAENPAVKAMDHYFVTLDAKTGSSIEELFAFSQRGLAFNGNRNAIGDNAILEDFYRKTDSLDQEMANHRDAALAAMKSGDFTAAVQEALAAKIFFPDDKSFADIFQTAPRSAAEQAMKQKRWQEANQWIARGREIAPDRAKFEKFAADAAFECAMSEAHERFDAGDFEAASAVAQRASGIAPADRGRKAALELAAKARIEHHLAVARRARDADDIDAQFDAAMAVIGLDGGSKEARELATAARQRMLADAGYFGKYFRVVRRIELNVDRLWKIAFTHDGKRLHGYFDSDPRQFVAWDVETGGEIERRELDKNYNVEMTTPVLASLLLPVGMHRGDVDRASSTANNHERKQKQIETTQKKLRESIGRLTQIQSTGGSARDIEREQQRIENMRKQLDDIGPIEAPVSSIGYRIRRFLGTANDCTLPLAPEYAGAKRFLSRSERMMAIAPKTDEGRVLLVDPSRSTVLREVKLPFPPNSSLSHSDGKMGINDVEFSSDLSIVAAANDYGAASFRVADGQMLYSGKSTDAELEKLLGVSNDGREIAFSTMSSFMSSEDWYSWNLGDGTTPRKAQGSCDQWKLTSDLKFGIGRENSRIQVFVPGNEEPVAEFDPPKAKEENGTRIRIVRDEWDLSSDGRKLAIADNGAIEIWGTTPPPLPE